MKVVIGRLALDDLKDIALWIGRDNPRRAASFSLELRRKCSELSTRHGAYPIVHTAGTREVRRRVFGRYRIFYGIEVDRVLIYRILHSARDERQLLPESDA